MGGVQLLPPCASAETVSACEYRREIVASECRSEQRRHHILILIIPEAEIFCLKTRDKRMTCLSRNKMERTHAAVFSDDFTPRDIVGSGGNIAYHERFTALGFCEECLFIICKFFVGNEYRGRKIGFLALENHDWLIAVVEHITVTVNQSPGGGMVDAEDSKSSALKSVRVRVSPRAP